MSRSTVSPVTEGLDLRTAWRNGCGKRTNAFFLGDDTMDRLKMLALRLLRDEEGQDLIEYALLATFVSLVAIAGATLLGNSLNTWYSNVSGAVDDAATKAGASGS